MNKSKKEGDMSAIVLQKKRGKGRPPSKRNKPLSHPTIPVDERMGGNYDWTSAGADAPVSDHIMQVLNETLRPDDRDGNGVECGICRTEMTYRQFRLHNIHLHLNTAQTSDGNEAEDRQYFIHRLAQLVALTGMSRSFLCPNAKCDWGTTYKSHIGLADHMLICGKSGQDLEALLTKCTVCQKKLVPRSLKRHMKIHDREPAKMEVIPEDDEDDKERSMVEQLHDEDAVDGDPCEDVDVDGEPVDNEGADREPVNDEEVERGDDEDVERGDDEEVDVIPGDEKIDGSSNGKRTSEDDDSLEDADYDLLEENLGTKIHRGRHRKRVKHIVDSDDDAIDADAIASELFDASDNEEDSCVPDRETPLRQSASEESEGDYSDINDIIDDDEVDPSTDDQREPSVNDEALKEAHEIFGSGRFDYDAESEDKEDGVIRRDRSNPMRNAKYLRDVFEPYELDVAGLSNEVIKIKSDDIPERMQQRSVPITQANEKELDEEAKWINQVAFRNRGEKEGNLVPKIRNALDFMRNQLFEVPFIAFYRKESVFPELSIDDLWYIYRLDARFCTLKQRKVNLFQLYKNMREHQKDLVLAMPDGQIPDSLRHIKDCDLDRVEAIKSSEEINDMQVFFDLHYADEVIPMKEGLARKRREVEQRAKEAAAQSEGGGIDPSSVGHDKRDHDLENESSSSFKRPNVKKFGLSPEEFAENVRDNFRRHEVQQHALSPLDAIKEIHLETGFEPEKVLEAAVYVMGTEIAREPLVRKCVRKVFFDRATISCKPTANGIAVIDESHRCFSMKYLKDKPVRDVEGDQFLTLTLAEKAHLITIQLGEKIKGVTSVNYIDELNQLFQKDKLSKHLQEWNTLRGKCIEFAFEKLLFPELRAELRAKLSDNAKEHVIDMCSKKLDDRIKRAPYSISFPGRYEEWNTSQGLRVLAIAYVPNYRQASYAVLVNPDGHPSESLELQNITTSSHSLNLSYRQEKKAVLATLRSLIERRKPHVVVVGGESPEAIMVQKDIQQVTKELGNDSAFPSIPVEIVDNQLAKAYAESAASLRDFPNCEPLLRQAVSLGRSIQDPLLEYSQLCTEDNEILHLKFHSLQGQVPKEELLERLHMKFANWTNLVGVDVNRAINDPFTSNLVQFTCGLGHWKATALIKTLTESKRRLETRSELITTCHMGPKIFTNCSRFIKIDTKSIGESTEYFPAVLDSTHVHGRDPPNLREVYHSPNAEEIFNMLSKETLYVGKLVTASVLGCTRLRMKRHENLPIDCIGTVGIPANHEVPDTEKCQFCGQGGFADVSQVSAHLDDGSCTAPLTGVSVRLEETRIRGFVPNKMLSDVEVADPRPLVLYWKQCIPRLIECRVVFVDRERVRVECSTRLSDINDVGCNWKPPKDLHYDHAQEDFDKQRIKAINLKSGIFRRLIDHTAFQNVSCEEVEEQLKREGNVGEAIFNPSAKGVDLLTLTWKVAEGTSQQIEVREAGKPDAVSLGKSLWIEEKKFEDLDEIIATFVTPMAKHARDLEKYCLQVEANAVEFLKKEMRANPAKPMHYCFQLLPDKDAVGDMRGCFRLCFVLQDGSNNTEFVKLTPDGFVFRGKVFSTVLDLVDWFGVHALDPPPAFTRIEPPLPPTPSTPPPTPPPPPPPPQ